MKTIKALALVLSLGSAVVASAQQQMFQQQSQPQMFQAPQQQRMGEQPAYATSGNGCTLGRNDASAIVNNQPVQAPGAAGDNHINR